MEATVVLLGVVVFAVLCWNLARFAAWLNDVWPTWAVALLMVVIILVSTYVFAVATTYFDPNYPLTSLPFWPSSWLKGH